MEIYYLKTESLLETNMRTQNYSKTELISLLKDLEQRIGAMPKKKQWVEDASTPSDMPIRMLFGNWNKFLKEAGYAPRTPTICGIARINSIAARKGRVGGNNNGGRIIDKFGYVQIWMPDHPNAKMGGYIHEHRLVMSKILNRPLFPFENVHHKNGIRSDNSESNLELWDKTQPSGQRVEDRIDWAIKFLKRHNYIIYENPELLK